MDSWGVRLTWFDYKGLEYMDISRVKSGDISVKERKSCPIAWGWWILLLTSDFCS